MGVELDIWYRWQAEYFVNCLNNGVSFNESFSLCRIWKYIVKLGCSYGEELTQKCWDNAPEHFKDYYWGIFIDPK